MPSTIRFANDKTFRLISKPSPRPVGLPLGRQSCHQSLGGKRNHLGVDVKTKPKDKIVGGFDGVVTLLGTFSGMATASSLRHAYGFERYTGHQFKNGEGGAEGQGR
jgi:hypothetical protein